MAYGRLRRLPVLGAVASRLVWSAKGLLGRPVAVAATPAVATPPPRRPRQREAADVTVRIALEAAWTLQARVTALEARLDDAAKGPPHLAAPRVRGEPASWSVIVPTLDRAVWLDRALWALAYQNHETFEVIVARGPCRDDTDTVLARHAARIRVVTCGEANIAAARNAGLRIARGEAVAFLDDDAVPEPDWLQRLGEGLRDPGVGGVGGFIRDAGGVGFQCRTVVADRFGGSRDVGPVARGIDPPGPAVERYLSLTGANSAFRTEALRAVGGFDEAYAYFLDETDVCLRLVEAGWRLAVIPGAEVHHGYAKSAQRDALGAPRRLIDCVRSTAYFTLRHGARRHGLVEAAERLQAYASGLVRDTAWRADHGLTREDDAERMTHEIVAGVSEGVRQALGGPSHLLAQGSSAGRPPACGPIGSSTATLRPARDRLRVALLCQDYPGQERPGCAAGGIAVWMHALAEALAGRGHEVSVFAGSEAAESSVAFQAFGGGGLWLHRTAAAPAPGRTRSPALAAAPAGVAARAQGQAGEVMRVHPRRRFDLALGPLWDLQPADLLDRAPFPVGVSLHTACAQLTEGRTDWDAAYRRSHVDKVVAAERRLLASAPRLLANSAASLADLAAAFGLSNLAERATILPHGLPDLARGVVRARRPGGVELLFVGRLERRKGIDVVLAAAPHILAAAPDVHLTLVGEETLSVGPIPLAEAFRRRHAGAPWLDRVAFVGAAPRAELLARYAACDIVLAPSRYESFGLVALEAMIFAKPSIVGDAGGLRDLVVQGETGLRVAPGDVDALVAAALSLAAAPERRAAMGVAARARYAALYTASAMADGFEAWSREVVGRSGLALAAE